MNTYVTRWNPLREFEGLLPGLSATNTQWSPAVDVYETNEDYRIEVELPAVAADDVTVSFKDAVLSVSGERKRDSQSQDRPHRSERPFGKFSRSFRLPELADEDAITARAKDGVLYINVAKKVQEGPRQIEVQVH